MSSPMTNKQAQELLIQNGQMVADTLRHLADNEIDSDYFAITSTSENGTEIEHELVITDYALQAASTVEALVEALESAQEIRAAAEKLVRCKGRYHSEQNYRALAALFGVTTPDLPPMDETLAERDADKKVIADSVVLFETLRQRIAELEARAITVTIPAAYDITGETDGNCQLNDASMQADVNGCYFLRRDVEQACTAAGIKCEVKGE